MTDSKQKCQGCGAETMSDVGWCLACRSILYTPLQIAESDFRRSEFKTMVFPVRDVVWLQERVRLRDAEIKAMDTVNDEMGATILSLRADLAEAKADVHRFEAALDAANKELAQARRERDEAREATMYVAKDRDEWKEECQAWREQHPGGRAGKGYMRRKLERTPKLKPISVEEMFDKLRPGIEALEAAKAKQAGE